MDTTRISEKFHLVCRVKQSLDMSKPYKRQSCTFMADQIQDVTKFGLKKSFFGHIFSSSSGAFICKSPMSSPPSFICMFPQLWKSPSDSRPNDGEWLMPPPPRWHRATSAGLPHSLRGNHLAPPPSAIGLVSPRPAYGSIDHSCTSRRYVFLRSAPRAGYVKEAEITMQEIMIWFKGRTNKDLAAKKNVSLG